MDGKPLRLLVMRCVVLSLALFLFGCGGGDTNPDNANDGVMNAPSPEQEQSDSQEAELSQAEIEAIVTRLEEIDTQIEELNDRRDELEIASETVQNEIDRVESIINREALSRDYRGLVTQGNLKWSCSFFERAGNDVSSGTVQYRFSGSEGSLSSATVETIFTYDLTNDNSITLVYSNTNDTEVLNDLMILDENVFIASSSKIGPINCVLQSANSEVLTPLLDMLIKSEGSTFICDVAGRNEAWVLVGTPTGAIGSRRLTSDFFENLDTRESFSISETRNNELVFQLPDQIQVLADFAVTSNPVEFTSSERSAYDIFRFSADDGAISCTELLLGSG